MHAYHVANYAFIPSLGFCTFDEALILTGYGFTRDTKNPLSASSHTIGLHVAAMPVDFQKYEFTVITTGESARVEGAVLATVSTMPELLEVIRKHVVRLAEARRFLNPRLDFKNPFEGA